MVLFEKILLSTSNVGIGTTTPKNRLDVSGAVAIGAGYAGVSAAPTNGLIVSGNVGIGTTNPQYALDVNAYSGKLSSDMTYHTINFSAYTGKGSYAEICNIYYSIFRGPYVIYLDLVCTTGSVGYGANISSYLIHVAPVYSINASGTWYKVLPIQRSLRANENPSATYNYILEFKYVEVPSTGHNVTLRLVTDFDVVSGGSRIPLPATAHLRIQKFTTGTITVTPSPAGNNGTLTGGTNYSNPYIHPTSLISQYKYSVGEFIGGVGIGTEYPGYNVDIYSPYGTGNTVLNLNATATTGQARVMLRSGSNLLNRQTAVDFYNHISSSSTPQWSLVNDYAQSGSNDMSFVRADGLSRVMTMTQSCNVGIGTTTPLSRLHIHETVGTSNSAASGSLVFSHADTKGVQSIVFKSQGAANDYAHVSYYESTSNTTYNYFGATGTESGGLILGCENDANTPSIGPDSVIITPAGNTVIDPKAGITYITGNVGIGSTNPTYKLDVVGPMRTTGVITRSFTRTVDNTANNVYDIASFGPNFAYEFEVSIHGDQNAVQLTKTYIVTTSYPGGTPFSSGTSYLCLPISQIRNSVDTDDVELVVVPGGSGFTFKLVHSAVNQAAPVFTVNIVCKYPTNTAPVVSDLTGNAPTVIAGWSSYAICPTTPITQRLGNVGISTTNPIYTLDVNGSTRITGKLFNSFYFIMGASTQNYVYPLATYTGIIGSMDFDVTLLCSESGASMTKIYRIPAVWVGNNTYATKDISYRCLPFNHAEYGETGDTADLLITINTNAVSFSVVHTYHNNLAVLYKYTVNITCTYARNDVPTVTNNTGNAATLISNWASTCNIFPGTPFIQRNGNIGIGTINPTQKLQVDGNSIIGNAYINNATAGTDMVIVNKGLSASATTSFALFQNTTGDTVLNSASGRNLAFKINNVERMTLDSTGKVGIGNASPTANIHILNSTLVANSSVYIALGKSTANNNQAEIIYTHSGDGSANNFGSLGLYGTKVLNWTGNGNVGIGVTTPAYPLDVNGDIATNNFVIRNGVSGSDFVIFNRQKGVGVNTDAMMRFDGNGQVQIQANSGQNIQFQNANTQLMMIKSDGNVGIGTTNPTQKLQLDGNAIIGNTYINMYNTNDMIIVNKNLTANVVANFALFQGSTGDTVLNSATGKNISFKINNVEKMTIDSTGKVGIGNATPAYPLDVNGNANITRILLGNATAPLNTGSDYDCKITMLDNTTNTPMICFGHSNLYDTNFQIGYRNGVANQRYASGSNFLYFASWGSGMKMRIQADGNVGIGSDPPLNKLDVFGACAIGTYAGVNAAGANNLIISGNIGIGTTTPLYKLDVNGSARVTGIIQNSFMIGMDKVIGKVYYIATYNSTYGHDFDVSICSSQNSVSLSKTYRMSSVYSGTNPITTSTWYRCMPMTQLNYDSASTAEDVDLMIMVNLTNVSFAIAHTNSGDTNVSTPVNYTVNITCRYPQNLPPTITDNTANATGTTTVSSLPFFPSTVITQRNGNVGIGTVNPQFKIHSTGSLFIGDFAYASTTIPGSSIAGSTTANSVRLVFDNTYNGNVGSGVAANKIVLHNNNGAFGFGIETGAITYHSTGNHNFYSGNSTTAYGTKILGITSTGISVTGSVSATGGKPFVIHHPNRVGYKLVHCAVEGPRCDLMYRGKVQLINGVATINIDKDSVTKTSSCMTDGTFETLCRNPDYYLQNNTSFDKVIGSIDKNILTIRCENIESTDVVSWMVIAERKDSSIISTNITDDEGYLVTEHVADTLS